MHNQDLTGDIQYTSNLKCQKTKFSIANTLLNLSMTSLTVCWPNTQHLFRLETIQQHFIHFIVMYSFTLKVFLKCEVTQSNCLCIFSNLNSYKGQVPGKLKLKQLLKIVYLNFCQLFFKEPRSGNKKKFANKMRSIVSAVKTAQRLEVRLGFAM